ncbi:hypothetical protein F4775DRAFT_590598 [Biscogniauxia sp. FL1348]|nr:hypothetical protein F4775DRAFT_590598 [Biscogniauxia sp. FL1348]
MTHRSFFSYNITHAYPFEWFTPVVFVGAVLLIVLVSFANVAATGYELVSASTYDPNATEANSIWYAKWPGFLTGARASALSYTLKMVWQAAEDGMWTDEAALPAVFTMGDTVTATAQCYVKGSPGSTYIELVSTYDANPLIKHILYRGYSLLAMYWRSAMQAFFDESSNSKYTDFFAVDACWFIPINATGIAFLDVTSCDTASLSVLIDGGSGEKPLPGVWNSVNNLAKAMPQMLEALSSDLTVVNQTLRSEFRWGIKQDNLLSESFDPSACHDAPLGITPTLLLADCLCQVPRLKSSGNLIVSVLVADLVILQVVWKPFALFGAKTLIKKERRGGDILCSLRPLYEENGDVGEP